MAVSVPDPRTFEKPRRIIRKVYRAGGCPYLWMWGDPEREFTAKIRIFDNKGNLLGFRETKNTYGYLAQPSMPRWTFM